MVGFYFTMDFHVVFLPCWTPPCDLDRVGRYGNNLFDLELRSNFREIFWNLRESCNQLPRGKSLEKVNVMKKVKKKVRK